MDTITGPHCHEKPHEAHTAGGALSTFSQLLVPAVGAQAFLCLVHCSIRALRRPRPKRQPNCGNVWLPVLALPQNMWSERLRAVAHEPLQSVACARGAGECGALSLFARLASIAAGEVGEEHDWQAQLVRAASALWRLFHSPPA